MKKVLFMIEHLKGGGAERVICELSKELSKNFDVTLLIFEDRGTTYKHCNKVININIPGNSNFIKKIINFYKRYKIVRSIKKKEQFDACISFINTANLVNVFTGGKNVICSIRTVMSNVIRNRVSIKLWSVILNRADIVVSLSNYVKQDLIDNFNICENKIITIYNPCSKAKSRAFEKQLEPGRLPIFISVGRCVEAKGQWHLLKSFSLLLRSGVNARLIILGEGPLLDELKNLAIKLNIDKSVDFKGFVENPYQWYETADIFVMPSVWEGFGNAIVEAMSCSLPVICTCCSGGPREIINPNNESESLFCKYGILTEPFPKKEGVNLDPFYITKEEKMLCKCMELMLESENMAKYSKMSLVRAKDFSISSIASHWEHLINY